MNEEKNREKSIMRRMGFIDTTLRNGPQGLWAMKMTYGMVDAVAGKIDQGGYDCIDIPTHALHCKAVIQFFNEDPWPTIDLSRDAGRLTMQREKQFL